VYLAPELFFEKPEDNRTFGRPTRIGEVNIKMYLIELDLVHLNWIHLARIETGG
jgi:hypothetical protein